MGLREKAGRWYYRFRISGRQYEGSTGLVATRQNLKAAKEIEAEERLRRAQGLKPSRYDGIRFKAAAEEFLLWCKHTEYRKKVNTAKRIAGSFASLSEFFSDLKVAAITAIDVERYKTHRSTVHHVKDVTIRNDLNALSLFFGYAIRASWRNSNPLLGHNKVKRPSAEDAVRIHIITEEEETAYFSYAKGNLADLAKLMLLQGSRPEEILSLKKTAYNERANTIRIEGGKTPSARRTLFLTSEAKEIIERRIAAPDQSASIWLFHSSRNHSPGDHHIVQMHTPHDSACQNAGVSFVLYDLRHTFATRYTQSGGDIPTLASILGHSGLRAVMKYVHPTAEHQREGMKQYELKTRPARLVAIKKNSDE